MKLFKVEFTVTAIVAGNDRIEALSNADDEWRDIRSETPLDQVLISVGSEISGLSELPEPWDGVCFPYGVPATDKRIKDYLP